MIDVEATIDIRHMLLQSLKFILGCCRVQVYFRLLQSLKFYFRLLQSLSFLSFPNQPQNKMGREGKGSLDPFLLK